MRSTLMATATSPLRKFAQDSRNLELTSLVTKLQPL